MKLGSSKTNMRPHDFKTASWKTTRNVNMLLQENSTFFAEKLELKTKSAREFVMIYQYNEKILKKSHAHKFHAINIK